MPRVHGMIEVHQAPFFMTHCRFVFTLGASGIPLDTNNPRRGRALFRQNLRRVAVLAEDSESIHLNRCHVIGLSAIHALYLKQNPSATIKVNNSILYGRNFLILQQQEDTPIQIHLDQNTFLNRLTFYDAHRPRRSCCSN